MVYCAPTSYGLGAEGGYDQPANQHLSRLGAVADGSKDVHWPVGRRTIPPLHQGPDSIRQVLCGMGTLCEHLALRSLWNIRLGGRRYCYMDRDIYVMDAVECVEEASRGFVATLEWTLGSWRAY